jgi:hypothetical protein
MKDKWEEASCFPISLHQNTRARAPATCTPGLRLLPSIFVVVVVLVVVVVVVVLVVLVVDVVDVDVVDVVVQYA